ncbi:MAG: hypothetical protein N3G20_01010 [Verrucomicrobiae bacterium]|nr:hypothetical protein [Gemmatales bacterium]MCX8107362.1 hypothetical protein [Verrucomicrobiae bacterium]MDW8175830.1 hypothetical protein [Gemmatales bacterium]
MSRNFQNRPRTPGQIIRSLLSNSLLLIVGGYGLKCIVFMQGAIPVHKRYEPWFSFHLAEVSGTMAVFTGLGYIGLAVFASLSCGAPPEEERSCAWRIARGILRWGSLVGGFFAWQAVYRMRS